MNKLNVTWNSNSVCIIKIYAFKIFHCDVKEQCSVLRLIDLSSVTTTDKIIFDAFILNLTNYFSLLEIKYSIAPFTKS